MSTLLKFDPNKNVNFWLNVFSKFELEKELINWESLIENVGIIRIRTVSKSTIKMSLTEVVANHT